MSLENKENMAANNSDLILRCGGIKFEVHRATLCLKSPFFKVACYGEFRVCHYDILITADD
jgi:hypothetical protein